MPAGRTGRVGRCFLHPNLGRGVMSDKDMEQLAVNTIRMLAADMVEQANSGHPGMPLGAAPMAYLLWTRFMHYNPLRSPMGQPGPLRAQRGARLCSALCHVAPDRLRSFPGRPQKLPPVGQQDPRTPRVWRGPRRGSHHRAPGPGLRHGRGHGPGRALFGPDLQPPRLWRWWTTTPTPSSATAT